MRNIHHSLILTAAIALLAPMSAQAQTAASRVGRINNLKVLSDKIDDTTTPENILKSFVKPGMTDEQRAKALWTAAVKYRHQPFRPTSTFPVNGKRTIP